MPSINWDTVATSAITALTVTLATEYVAKPRLEARKERILAALRSRRELSAALTAIALPAAFLAVDMPTDAEPQARDSLRAERRRQYERMRDQAQTLMDNMDRHASTFHSMPMKLVMEYIGTVHGVMLSARTQHDKAKYIHNLSLQMALILDGRWWQIVARLRALQKFQQMVEQSREQTERAKPAEGERASLPVG